MGGNGIKVAARGGDKLLSLFVRL